MRLNQRPSSEGIETSTALRAVPGCGRHAVSISALAQKGLKRPPGDQTQRVQEVVARLNQRPSSEGIETSAACAGGVAAAISSISALAQKGLKHPEKPGKGRLGHRGLNQRPSSEGIETSQRPRRGAGDSIRSISALAQKGLKP